MAGAVLVVGAAELTARVMNLQSDYTGPIPNRSNCLRRSSLLGMEFRPNCEAVIEYTAMHTNSVGLRDAEIGNDDSVRVLSIGDSCTWGWGVAQDEAYPQVLQKRLNQRSGTGRYRVINAGRPGYTSYQGLVYLREFGLAFHPAIVIFAYGFNDAFRPGDVEQEIEWQRRWMREVELSDFLLSWSKLVRWLSWKTLSAHPPLTQSAVPPEKYKRNLTRIVQLAREHGARALMISFWDAERISVPTYAPPGSETFGPLYRQTATEVASELGVPLVVYSGPRLDIVHPTREGYVRLATDVAGVLQSSGLVSASETAKRMD